MSSTILTYSACVCHCVYSSQAYVLVLGGSSGHCTARTWVLGRATYSLHVRMASSGTYMYINCTVCVYMKCTFCYSTQDLIMGMHIYMYTCHYIGTAPLCTCNFAIVYICMHVHAHTIPLLFPPSCLVQVAARPDLPRAQCCVLHWAGPCNSPAGEAPCGNDAGTGCVPWGQSGPAPGTTAAQTGSAGHT